MLNLYHGKLLKVVSALFSILAGMVSRVMSKIVAKQLHFPNMKYILSRSHGYTIILFFIVFKFEKY
jgi:hypothetical protein